MGVPFNFPPSPSTGQTYQAATGMPIYTWDGEKWTTQGASLGSLYVLKTGDSMSGDLTISRAAGANTSMILDRPAVANAGVVYGKVAGVNRWSAQFGNAAAETGGNVGSNFSVDRYTDAGSYVDSPFTIVRNTGQVYLTSVSLTTAAEYTANSQPTKLLTSAAAWSAAATVIMTEAAGAVTPDLSLGLNLQWNISAANRTLNTPTNMKPGQTGLIYLVNGGAGTISSWGAYRFSGGVKPVLTQTNGAVDIISYIVGGGGGAMFCSFSADFK